MIIGDFYEIFHVIFGDFLVGTGEPPPYWDKITVLYGCGFKKLGLGQNPNFDRKFLLQAPLRSVTYLTGDLPTTPS